MFALAIASGHAYLTRPVADRFEGFRYDLVAMAAKAGADDVVILDDYSASVIRFLDAGHLPTIVPPGMRLPNPGIDVAVLALSRDDLATALGQAAAQRAVPLAWNPQGGPVVWGLSP